MGLKNLFSDAFLIAQWDSDFQAFRGSKDELALLETLHRWDLRNRRKETTDEQSFAVQFFQSTWGYAQPGTTSTKTHTYQPKFPVPDAGQSGNTGEADAALGFFDDPGCVGDVPQVLCEFKDIRSELDQLQHRKGNTRSPVRQCLDYLKYADDSCTGRRVPVRPSWAIVTDMNEFRLYARGHGATECQRFFISRSPRVPDGATALLDDSEEAVFQRFVFWRIFRPDLLLTRSGVSLLLQFLTRQNVTEKGIEASFYLEYRKFRETIYSALVTSNQGFHGTHGRLVRLSQLFLDRCVFILFCEDMGAAIQFPPGLLKDVLINATRDEFFDPESDDIWQRVKKLFASMRDGVPFDSRPINRFNGGLFAENPDLDGLHFPNRLFCLRNQAVDGDRSLRAHKDTLLYFSACYNFGKESYGGKGAIDLYTLGHIFEQSITELEIMEAVAEGRPSINLLTKRKRDGVYYTPEGVTLCLVEETLGARLNDLKREVGLMDLAPLTEDDIQQYRLSLKDKRRTAPLASAWVKALRAYREALDRIKVVDPACGSGAFLIQALDYLLKERLWIADELYRITGHEELFDSDEARKNILSNNIYGVDINAESVEIAKLSLWLHTAMPGKPLCALDRNIRCGNSLVGTDFKSFYQEKHATLFEAADERTRERINAFDWWLAFPDVKDQGGFDCVVSNPPYVKLQNFRQVESDVADYLVAAKRLNGTPLYASTQTGNFDMYLPFIEKGISLLNEKGRMGYIAPNVWTVNDYGKGLRQFLASNHCLDRWVDFKSYQVFEEAITYTALQFYTKTPNAKVRCAFVPNGNVAGLQWDQPSDAVCYDRLPADGEVWNFMPANRGELIAKLVGSCARLEDFVSSIFQGIKTSADAVYQLQRIAPGKFLARTREIETLEVEIEDALMRPLVSGPEAKRYTCPNTDTYVLFPYDVTGSKPRLYDEQEMQTRFPRGWAYLRTNEQRLREREGRSFNDHQWYRFGRNQSLDKQGYPKLGVATTVPEMRVFYDVRGEFCFSGARVEGVLATSPADNWYLLAVMNSPPFDYIFRHISRPKEAGWFEANKQFIAPLPIPKPSAEQKKAAGSSAQRLQELHTERRDKVAMVDARLTSPQAMLDIRTPDWLWSDVRANADEWVSAAPAQVTSRGRKAWAKKARQDRIEEHVGEFSGHIIAGTAFTVQFERSELRVLADGVPVVSGVFVSETDGAFIAAQWRHALRDLNVTDRFNGKRLLKLLLELHRTDNNALRSQVIELDREIAALDSEIAKCESKIDALVYQLYGITDPREIRMIEEG